MDGYALRWIKEANHGFHFNDRDSISERDTDDVKEGGVDWIML
jgi:hypothetical protein